MSEPKKPPTERPSKDEHLLDVFPDDHPTAVPLDHALAPEDREAFLKRFSEMASGRASGKRGS